MDLQKILKELYAERQRIVGMIETLEKAGRRSPPATRRGRKKMDTDARKAVSERMKRYWASRKTEPISRDGAEPTGPPTPSTEALD
jgi:hypothetical protein